MKSTAWERSSCICSHLCATCVFGFGKRIAEQTVPILISERCGWWLGGRGGSDAVWRSDEHVVWSTLTPLWLRFPSTSMLTWKEIPEIYSLHSITSAANVRISKVSPLFGDKSILTGPELQTEGWSPADMTQLIITAKSSINQHSLTQVKLKWPKPTTKDMKPK